MEVRGVSCGTRGRIEGFIVWDASSIVAGRFYIRSELFKSWSLLLERGPLFVTAAGRIILEAACSSFKYVGEVLRRVAADWFFLLLAVFSIEYQDCVFPSLCAAWEVNTW